MRRLASLALRSLVGVRSAATRAELVARAAVPAAVDQTVRIVQDANTLHHLLADAAESGEAEFLDDSDVTAEVEALAAQTHALQQQLVADSCPQQCGCYVQVAAGAGGRDSDDWASMLVRMYQRWAGARGWASEQLAEDTIRVGAGETSLAYPWLRFEQGVHRLVRISPFDSARRRHTSFASVRITPAISAGRGMLAALPDQDVRIDTLRSSGPGGQHVNKTESAVRATHIPSGLSVKAQSSRSQHRNRAAALSLLLSRVVDQKRQEADAALQAKRRALPVNAFGSQIRSYVLAPYQLVKDHRTGYEDRSPQQLLDGDLDHLLLDTALALLMKQ